MIIFSNDEISYISKDQAKTIKNAVTEERYIDKYYRCISRSLLVRSKKLSGSYVNKYFNYTYSKG